MDLATRLRNLVYGPAPEADSPSPWIDHDLKRKRRMDGGPACLSLALQGGGSFGAFTWGVLDRLLEEPELEFDTISGSSAGAINATLLAYGLAEDGPAAARRHLERFWRRASGAAPSPPLSFALSLSTRMLSPYQFNPLDLNPLRSLLEGEIDFALLREAATVRLLIGATRVADGRLHLFREHEVTADVLLASACLPLLQQAVEIDGEAYWDGGYAANPPLIPLVQQTTVPDILVVQVIPEVSRETPQTAREIVRRLEHMTFNASLLRDLDILADMRCLAEAEGHPRSSKLHELAVTRIAAEDHYAGLDEKSALRLDWSFLRDLHDAGRSAATQWLGRTTEANRYDDASPSVQSAVSPSRNVG